MLKKGFLPLFLLVSLILASSSAQAGYLPEFDGKSAFVKDVGQFKKLPKLEVIEFFNFACGHCYDFALKGEEALLKKYGDRIVYKAMPIYWGSQTHYPSFLYLMQDKGSNEEKYRTRRMVFDAYFEDKINIFEKQTLGMLIPDFSLASDYIRRADTPEARKLAEDVLALADELGVHETPTVVINRSIVVNPAMSGKTVEEFIANLNVVIDSVLKKYYVK